MTRYGWDAEPPRGELTRLNLPVERVITSQTGNESCTSRVNNFNFDSRFINFSCYFRLFALREFGTCKLSTSN